MDAALMELADHVEMEHERELGGFDGTLADLREMHDAMHARSDHWGHEKGITK